MSVRSLIKEKEESELERVERYRIKEENRVKKERTQQFREEVQQVIRRFETQCFNINSTEDGVAEFIVNGGRSKLSWSNQSFNGIQFEDGAFPKDFGHTPIKNSRKFTQWKKALEDKFGVKIRIRKEYERHRRFGNSGYETFPDYTYEGLIAVVYIPDEE